MRADVAVAARRVLTPSSFLSPSSGCPLPACADVLPRVSRTCDRVHDRRVVTWGQTAAGANPDKGFSRI
ncbi:hypothetical protein BCEN4_2720001 [Burkholderia cenocepacia]|nr:hypothetical protein BCEN4_2720001 [Burkholderia cenocepacia]